MRRRPRKVDRIARLEAERYRLTAASVALGSLLLNRSLRREAPALVDLRRTVRRRKALVDRALADA